MSGGPALQQEQIVLLSKDGTRFRVEAMGDSSTHLLVLSGEPIDEPIAARGPFVMNTERELTEAVRDYQSGRF